MPDTLVERECDVDTPDGVGSAGMNTFVVHPAAAGPWPVVLFLMDAPGRRPELEAMARRLAMAGHYVMLPNLYYRRTRHFELQPDSRAAMVAHMNSLDNAMVVRDCAALLAVAASDPAAGTARIGCVGYCMSGPFAFALAAALPDRVAAAASFHGVRLCTDAPDSPHRDAARIRGELYFGCAEIDEWAPPATIADLDDALRAAGANYRIEWYPGTRHGFVFPGRPVYHPEAAEQHWARLLDLFARNLGQQTG